MKIKTSTGVALLFVCAAALFPNISSAATTHALDNKPTIISVSGNKLVRWQGGSLKLTIRTINAVACAITVKGKPYIDVSYDKAIRSCGPGSFSTTINVHRNANPFSESATFWALANSHNTTVHFSFTVNVNKDPSSTQVGSPTSPTTTEAPPPVVDLDACTAGPKCDYGPIYDSFQNWGNTAPADLGDCTFAAAANWEQIVLGVDANSSVIGYQFAEAGGNAATGLAQTALFSYWERDGISGVIAKGFNKYLTDQTDVQNGVRDYGAMIVELQFVANDGFGQYSMSPGSHDVVVDGFTPAGPLVVSWGETLQMTWAQWNAEIIGMWGVAA